MGIGTDIAGLLFTTKSTVLNGQTLPGLGLTIARYNAGGFSARFVGGSVMHASPRFPAYRQMQGYWLDPNQADPASDGWDWTADASQRLMLQKARDRGAIHFELFSNSPMCRNLNPSGADAGAEDNLQPASPCRLFGDYRQTCCRPLKYSRQEISLSGKQLRIWLAPNSVQTLELNAH